MTKYSIKQLPCPQCGHVQQDTVMHHYDFIKHDMVESICTECGTRHMKPICKNGEPKI